MVMTNYMELLATNSPWNLIVFMAIPVIVAEALVATEFYSVYLANKKNTKNTIWRKANHWLGIFAGGYFAIIVIYLLINVIPSIEWRGIIDQIAVICYLLGIVPLGAISLMELNIIGHKLEPQKRMKAHFQWLIVFLIIGHVAMVFGMLNPMLSGWHPSSQMEMNMMNHQSMQHSPM